MDINKKTTRYSNSKNNIRLVSSILKENGPMTFSELLLQTKLEKSSLNATLKKMATDRMIKDFSRGKKISFDESQKFIEPLKKADILKWLILFALNEDPGGKSADEIAERCLELSGITTGYRKFKMQKIRNEEKIRYKETTLEEKIPNNIRRYLKSLHEAGLIDKEKSVGNAAAIYKINEMTPLMKCLTYEQMEQYVTYLSMNGTESVNEETAIRLNRILWGDEDSSCAKAQVYGKLNQIAQEDLTVLDKLLELPYKNKKILISGGKNSKKEFSVGLIFYATETNAFYLLGKHGKKDDIIRVSSIKDLKLINKGNDIYRSDYYKVYFGEMTGSEIAEPSNVRIRLRNKEYIRKRLTEIAAIRKTAAWSTCNNDSEILYTDRVRGINQLAHELRTFGADVIVEEPAVLRNMMISTAENVMRMYSE